MESHCKKASKQASHHDRILCLYSYGFICFSTFVILTRSRPSPSNCDGFLTHGTDLACKSYLHRRRNRGTLGARASSKILQLTKKCPFYFLEMPPFLVQKIALELSCHSKFLDAFYLPAYLDPLAFRLPLDKA